MVLIILTYFLQNDSLSYQVWQELNLLRSQPKQYITILENYKNEFKGYYKRKNGHYSLLTLEGTDAVDEVINELNELDELPRLRFSNALSKAAQDHVDDQSISGETGHEGSDGLYSEQRARRYGQWQRTIGENIHYGSDSAREIVISLLVDDAILDRGHRLNILNPNFRVVGIANGPHKIYQRMCVMVFSAGFIPIN